jgi:hypothetical protein
VNGDAWLTVPVIPTLYRPLALPRSATLVSPAGRRETGDRSFPLGFQCVWFIVFADGDISLFLFSPPLFPF